MKLRKMPIYETAADGRKSTRQSLKWYAVFVDFAGVLRRLPLLPDRRASDELSRAVNRLNSLRSSGESVLPPELSRAVEDMPAGVRDRLAAWDIIPAAKIAAAKPLGKHLDDWQAALLAKGNTPAHAATSAARVRRVVEGCGFATFSDVSASKAQRFVAELRQDRTEEKGGVRRVRRGISAASFNYYLRDARSFFRWMVRDKRAHENPLEHLQGVNARTDKRHERRALSADELRWLLDVTEKGYSLPGADGRAVKVVEAVSRFGMTNGERATLYRLAVETGLRANELRSLTRASFTLDGDEPSVTIAAAYAKNRRQDSLPLRAGTVKRLAEHLDGKMPAAVAFALPAKDTVVEMLRADLADARRAWLESHQSRAERLEAEKGAFLAYVDDVGRYADFHALRHTFISNLAAGGVHPKTAQRLARHSTITLTMDRYTHLHRDDLTAALGTLPDLSAPKRQAIKATGTDDPRISLSPSLSLNRATRRNSAHPGAMNSPDLGKSESPDRIEGNSGFAEAKPACGLLAELADAMDSKSIAPNPQPPPAQLVAISTPQSVSPSLSLNPPASVNRLQTTDVNDLDLAAVLNAWAHLPADVRKMIAGVVNATVAARKAKGSA